MYIYAVYVQSIIGVRVWVRASGVREGIVPLQRLPSAPRVGLRVAYLDSRLLSLTHLSSLTQGRYQGDSCHLHNYRLWHTYCYISSCNMTGALTKLPLISHINLPRLRVHSLLKSSCNSRWSSASLPRSQAPRCRLYLHRHMLRWVVQAP